MDNHLIYDDVSNVTWSTDVLYAKTSGFDTDSKMTWANSDAWANGLNAFGFSDWRLPTLTEGLALATQAANFGLLVNPPANIDNTQFWTSTENLPNRPDRAFWFRLNGTSNPVVKTADRNIWAVIDGDVAANPISAVSEPATMAIFALGLAGLAYRRKQLKADK